MDWFVIFIFFCIGVLLGVGIGLFVIEKVEDEPRGETMEERLNTIEERLKEQNEINQFQAEMNEHLSRWICKVSKKEK